MKLTADLHESSGAISCIDWLSIRHYVCCFAPNSILCTGLRNREEKNWSHCCSNIGSRTPVISTPTFCSGDRDGYPRGMYEIFHAWKICQVIRPFLSNKRIYVSFHFIFFFRFNIDISVSRRIACRSRVQTISPNANRLWKHVFIFHLAPFARLSRKDIRSRDSLSVPDHIRVL